ncbi:hypothetical protein [Streptomyces sp. VRA16 Mangrove soil]|uniref:hypothetical protein n=1 Tax=Streptomyces sp. VRA16 Mangrove soil TaxID=2817434 RepID=UPI001A9DFB92|nr:hypothetical protein [Streptomyces sp. VRA16 Mangrove soil]MBO1331992.1 hypothetical protein [Streptomyces sp. VRA16 Mangrove soil]
MAPRADCIADSAGGLTFDVTDHGSPDFAHLVLAERASGREVRLPLAPVGDGRLRASLPIGVDLPEGRWDAFAQVAGGEPVRLMPGMNDLRSLVDRAPGGSRGYVAVRIPYATKHGNLTVRSWHRAPHAEAGELRITAGELSVRGRLYGVAFSAKAYAELRARSESGAVVRAELDVDGAEFTVRIGYGELGAGRWDLWVRPEGEDGTEVRMARLLDDIADKKPIFTYPVTRVTVEGQETEAEPYYTGDNDLAVVVRAVTS